MTRWLLPVTHTWLPILAFLKGGDGLTVPARSREVKDSDGFVVTCPDVRALPVKGYTIGSCDFISCIIGSVDAPQASCASIP